MSFWTAAVIIAAIIAAGRVFRSRHLHDPTRSDKEFENISQRMGKLEDRMANIETIVLDREKEKKFTDL